MRPIDATLEGRLVAMRAGGASVEDIARALRLSTSTVSRYINRAVNAEVIEAARSATRAYLSTELARTGADGIAGKLLARLERAIDGGTSREIDECSRALRAVEQVGASVGGDADRKGRERVVRHVVELAPFARGEVVDAEVIPHTDTNGTARHALVGAQEGPVSDAEGGVHPGNSDGAPGARLVALGEKNDSRASLVTPRGPRGTAESDIPIPDDFEV
jgi:DNA-binding MarR family transcriptional regulator